MTTSTSATKRSPGAHLRNFFRPRVLRDLAIYLAVMLPLVWGLVAVEQSRFTALAEAGSNRDLRNYAHVFAQEVRATVGVVDLSLIQLRGSWQRDRTSFALAVGEHARHLRHRLPTLVHVLDARGRVLYSNAGPSRTGLDMSGVPGYRAHLGGNDDRFYASRPLISPLTKTWVVQFSRSIRDEQGQLQGVIIAAVSPEYFVRFYEDIDLGPTAAVSLIRSDGAVIARSTRGSSIHGMGTVLTDTPFAAHSPVTGRFRRLSQVDGIVRYYAWHKIPEYGMVVTVGEGVSDAEGRFARQREVLTWVGAAVSLVLALVGWAALGATDRRRRALKALAAAEARWKLALSATGDGVWDCDIVTGLATLSARAQMILDTDRSVISWYGSALDAMVHPEDLPEVRAQLRGHLAGRTQDFAAEFRVRMRNGDWSWIDTRGTVSERDELGMPLRMVGTFSNIDARKREEARMRRMAHEDALTGLPNRVLLGDRLRQAIRAASRDGHKVAVIYFDLDKFKPVNDTHGHAVGDRLLQLVGRRVRAGLRDADTLARIGGDEFVVLLPRCDSLADASRVAENILVQLNLPFEDGALVLHISGSLGIAMFPEHGMDAEDLLRAADLAMYDAKSHGRNRVSGRVR
ncbi:diguanylate cyclase domain-containing protein [Massilia yuzhufengensis]|uniref:PAS domain S-box-containing protein/diguanylate cyclase (GGDEF) domain-containing protein n=1 Tax=Massilia yuzhufengensis TaxID=1164594 RepID=A0A1I1WTF9_9BURK|nr:diguanylate cyclase [Massilia yuzhufengensis]SFD96733.1 PAS domain S-box-containing protein/diguanylate cyclase (GGDEF) domain-containing protein [Massilia yuzhufengensis]